MPGKRPYNGASNGTGPSSSNAVPLAGPAAAAGSSKSANEGDQSNTTLIISSLPLSYTSDSLSALLSAVGPIRVAFIVTSPGEAPQKSKGFGFGKFVLKDDAEKAIQELNGTLIDGKRIGVQWAKRRLRPDHKKGGGKQGFEQDDNVDSNADFISLAPSSSARPAVEGNIKNAYAERREAKRAARNAQEGGAAAGSTGVDNYKDSRTIVLHGGFDVADASNKKALQKKLKKLVFGINTGSAALQVHDVGITAGPSVTIFSSNNEEGEKTSHEEASVLLECPTPKVATQLAERLNNTVLKGQLILAKVKFENDTVGRKGKDVGGGRLIVRNLGFDVTVADLTTVFCAFGPLHSILLLKGFAFIWYLRHDNATAALAKINNTRIYHGMHRDRIEEAASHELTSTKKKKEKGKIVGLRGRLVAVDWALGKAEYEKLEAGGEATPASAPIAGEDAEKDSDASDEDDEEEDSDSDMDPVPFNEDDEDEDEDGDMSPVEEDALIDQLEPPSDVEDGDEEPAKPAHQPDEGATLFVRNIQFEATENELYNLFKAFGAVRYARIVMDPVTKRSRGTGFVNYYKEEDALNCLEEADRLATMTGSGAGRDGKGKKAVIPMSLLTADPSSALAAKLTLHGRVLGVSSAVSKGQADRLREDRDKSGKNKDRRNLYLMHEGTILPESPLASLLTSADVQNRQSSFEARRGLLRTNPALYISRTRLAIRQLPLFVTEGMLRRLAGWSIKAFNNDVKSGRRTKLTLDEMREPIDAMGSGPAVAAPKGKGKQKGKQQDDDDEEEDAAEDGSDAEAARKRAIKKRKLGKFGRESKVKQAKILRQEDRLDPLTGLQRSKGYGFLEMNEHSDALRVIRWANANADVHKLFHTWWIEDLENKIEGMTKSKAKPSERGTDAKDGKEKTEPEKLKPVVLDDEQKERIKRMKEKIAELQKEDDRSLARQGKSLIIEFSIENAMTVKRRQEKEVKGKEKDKAKKRKRERQVQDEEDAEQAAEPETAGAGEDGAAGKTENKVLGSIIGRKRRAKRAKH